MTLYDILVPAFALIVGGVGVLIVRLTDPERRHPRRR